jgi:hypothetical protein
MMRPEVTRSVCHTRPPHGTFISLSETRCGDLHDRNRNSGDMRRMLITGGAPMQARRRTDVTTGRL